MIGGYRSRTQALVAATFVLVTLFVPSTRAADVVLGHWKSAGGASTPRLGHTATVLPDGKVLIAGGGGGKVGEDGTGGEGLATAEIYDPATRAWTPTGNMRGPRLAHTATLLQDGKVLVVGGCRAGSWTTAGLVSVCSATASGTTSLATAELYDPGALDPLTGRLGSWTETDSMETDRYGHTATLLNDGRVLVAGGCQREGQCGPDSAGTLRSVEVYDADAVDPQTLTEGIWTPTTPMVEPEGRALHTATLLPDGTVLVAGGRVSFCNVTPTRTALATAELYDPEGVDPITGTRGVWRATAPLALARFFHAATPLVDGRVLVTGGIRNFADNGQPFCFFGNPPSDAPSATGEIYDPKTHSWQPTAPLNNGRYLHSATRLPSGDVLVTGGATGAVNGAEGSVATAELYRPPSEESGGAGPGEWSMTGELITGRRYHDAALLRDGTVFVIGGYYERFNSSTERFFLSEGEVLDPSLTIQPPSVVRLSVTAGPVGGGTEVKITGARLAGAASVRFGDVEAAFSVRSPTEIATSSPPAASPGTIYVTVTTRDGSNPPLVSEQVNTSAFTYGGDAGAPPPPSLSSAWPGSGPESGGTAVEISGSGFASVTGVTFGGTPTEFTVNSDTAIVAKSPPGQGSVDVRVRYGSAASLTKARFTYFPHFAAWAPTGAIPEHFRPSAATRLSGAECSAENQPSYCGDVLVIGEGIAGTQLWEEGTGTWQSCTSSEASAACPGPMTTGHSSPTATSLPDGSVLVVGSESGIFGTHTGAVTAELYDPPTGTWRRTGDPIIPRQGHTATLLDDGRVLVTGGVDIRSGSLTRLAELYDPSTEHWSTSGLMSEARKAHTATSLTSGRVLVAGGTNANGERLSSAEVYGPAEGTWTAAPSMATSRSGHQASELRDGSVLVTGGCCDANGAGLTSAELYQPGTGASGTWSTVGGTAMPRRGHSAVTLQDGSVLVAGGCCGLEEGGTAEIYDPATRRFTRTADLLEPRSFHLGVLLDNGHFLVFRGVRAGGGLALSSEIYETERRPPRVDHVRPAVGGSGGSPTTVTIEGRGLFPNEGVYFGQNRSRLRVATDTYLVAEAPASAQGTVDIIVRTPLGDSPSSDSAQFTYGPGAWTAVDPLTICTTSRESCGPRYWHSATLLSDGRVLVVGGAVDRRSLDTAELFDPATGRWRGTRVMHHARAQHSATLLPDGRVLVVGGMGSDFDSVKSSEIYDPATEQWTLAGPSTSPHGRIANAATLLRSGLVLVVGGSDHELGREMTASAELFDPRTNSWTAVPPMARGRDLHRATLLSDGRVLVTGGWGGIHGEAVWAQAEIYDPVSNVWRSTADMGVARYGHTATLIGGPRCGSLCNKVLVAGGNQTGGGVFTAAAELYDPVSGTWTPTDSLNTELSGHTATALADGSVLVAGRGPVFYEGGYPLITSDVAEVYDPETQRWRRTASMNATRGAHTATLLSGDRCGTECGKVLVVGGVLRNKDVVGSVELYAPAPVVSSIAPQTGPSSGHTAVTIRGYHLDRAVGVTFAGVPAESFTIDSPTQITAASPPRVGGPVEVAVTAPDSQTSAQLVPAAGSIFRFVGTPKQVHPLIATAVSPTQVRLTFPATAASDGEGPLPAGEYLVKQSPASIPPDGFDAANPLCAEGSCKFSPGRVGEPLELLVNDLEPGKAYHYRARAKNFLGVLGPLSEEASVTTPALPGTERCAPVGPAGQGQLAFEGGRYALVGVPTGTVIGADAPLYSWFDLGAGGSYALRDPAQAVDGAKGYWAFSFCNKIVSLSGSGEQRASMPLGAYHASMVGNPSGTNSASVTGHDFAARWDPSANTGAGGYQVSGYREAQPLAVGEGLWVFAYSGTTVDITAGG